MYRLENMHRSLEMQEITEKSQIKPGPSVKFDMNLMMKNLPEANMELWTEVEIENTDTITATLAEINNGYQRIMVMNMANAKRVGGGWLTGAEAQEEFLFRRTDLHETLVESLYPMDNDQVIYTPRAHIYRDAEYVDLESPVPISFISVAAIDRPRLHYGELDEEDYIETYLRVQMMFHISVIGKHDCLILSALGCGAFHNPPETMARIFAELCQEYTGYFKKIVFAIKSTNDHNCQVFQDVFIERFCNNHNVAT